MAACWIRSKWLAENTLNGIGSPETRWSTWLRARPAAGERKAIRGAGFNGEFALWMNPAARYHQLATAHVHAIGFRCAANVRAAK